MATENLHNHEALQKLKEMVDDIDVGMFCTFTNDSVHPHAVPMSRQEVCDQGNIWYLCSSDSQTFQNLSREKRVSVLFSKPGDYRFLAVNGTVETSQDQARIDKYWNRMMEAWFEKGKDDPRIRILKLTPDEAYYWDTNGNKLNTLFKMAAAAITGETTDMGKEGELSI